MLCQHILSINANYVKKTNSKLDSIKIHVYIIQLKNSL